MSSTHELKDVIKDTLENRGVLGQIKARIRAEVFKSLDDQNDSKPPLSNENMIINELIREYLEFNKYKYTASVMVAETGQPKQPLDRGFLAEELNVEEDKNCSQVPLLYSLVGQYMNKNRGKSTRSAMQNRGQSSRFLDELENDMDTTRSKSKSTSECPEFADEQWDKKGECPANNARKDTTGPQSKSTSECPEFASELWDMKGKRPANNARKVLEWIKRETNRQQTVPFCPWGGEIDGLTLDNTCTVDCHLYMIHLILIDEQFKAVKEWLHSQCKENPVASVLLRVSKLFEKKKWAEGKLIWIRETNPEAIDSEMGNVNLFGSEYDFFVGHYSTLQESVTENVCSNDNCPERGIERKYTEIVLHDSDTRTIQGAIDEWQNNSMDMVRCREKDPVSKRSCKGYRNWTRRRFTNSNIPKLVIANIENIKGEVSVGEEVVINDIRYSVYAITFGNGSHFIAVFNKNGSQQVYDGLKTSVEPLNILPARFSHVHVLLVMKVTD